MNLGNWLSTQVALGILRAALLAIGGALVADGFVSNADLTLIVGAILSLVTAIIGAWSNKRKADAAAVVKAVEAHPSLSLGTNAAGNPTIAIRIPFQDQPTPPSLTSPGIGNR